jgi:UDP-N-acetylglucosamine 2-epimerase
VETVEPGWNVLAGSDPKEIVQAALEAQMEMESAWPYGDDRAGERVVRIQVY